MGNAVDTARSYIEPFFSKSETTTNREDRAEIEPKIVEKTGIPETWNHKCNILIKPNVMSQIIDHWFLHAICNDNQNNKNIKNVKKYYHFPKDIVTSIIIPFIISKSDMGHSHFDIIIKALITGGHGVGKSSVFKRYFTSFDLKIK